MHVFIAGTGKLATELLDKLHQSDQLTISPWLGVPEAVDRAIVIHAGSGRELDEICGFCQRTASVLVELATGTCVESLPRAFPLVLCPNTNILMLKFMCMLKRSGSLFNGSQISVTESHQASKASVPGTAVSMALDLGLDASGIISVRDGARQATELLIPPEHLARHAYHRIHIHDGSCSISMETRVYGDAPYVSGVQQLMAAIQQRPLQNCVYAINEFIENGWI